MNTCWKKIPIVLVLFILIISIQACATGHPRSRGRLSDAMGKASDKNKGSRQVQVQERDYRPLSPPGYEERIAVEKGPSDNSGYPGQGDSGPEIAVDATEDGADDDKGANPFGLSGGVGWLRGDDFAKMINLDISFGSSDSTFTRSEIYFGAAWAGIDHSSELDYSLQDGVLLLSLGFNYKRKFFENTNWDAPYFIYGAAYRNMFWEYENTITTTDGETIHRDNLGGLEFKVGLGRNFLKANGNNFAIEVFPSVIFWLSPTDKGFENDVFDPFLILNVRGVFSSW